MTDWVVANRESVKIHSVLKAILASHLAYYVVLQIGQSNVLCTEVEQIFNDDYKLVYAPFSVNQAISDGKTNFSFYLRFDNEDFLRSGHNSLLVESKIDPANCSTKIYSPAPLRVALFCALCDKPNLNCIRTGPLAFIGEDHVDYDENQLTKLWAHAYCFSLSPRLVGETVTDFLKRCNQSFCSHCERRNASMFCENKRCHKQFHLECAAKSGAEYVETSGKLYCEKHLQQKCEENRKSIQYPSNSAIYLRSTDWSLIRKEDFNRIASVARLYQPLCVHWFRNGFYDFVQVDEIASGHWAYDSRFPEKKQYEVVARKDIPQGEIFGEYIGKVYYAHDQDSASHYCANVLLPESIADEVPALVIDSDKFGNEMRFINSVYPGITPIFVQKNVEFLTLWICGSPRIMLSAVRAITKGESLVLDYGKDFFEADKNK